MHTVIATDLACADETKTSHAREQIQQFKDHKNSTEVFFTAPKFMDKLAGTDSLRLAIEAGISDTEIRRSWQQGLNDYRRKRAPYLLYPLVAVP